MTDELPVPQKIDGKINLHSTLDARIWAKEFVKFYPQLFKDGEGVVLPEEVEEIMLAWFSNAIMTGIDHANWSNGKMPNFSMAEAIEAKEKE